MIWFILPIILAIYVLIILELCYISSIKLLLMEQIREYNTFSAHYDKPLIFTFIICKILQIALIVYMLIFILQY